MKSISDSHVAAAASASSKSFLVRKIGNRLPLLLTLADQGVASANNFLTGMIIGRSCSKQEFGIYMMGYSIILFLVTVQNALLGSPYTVRRSRLDAERLRLFTGSTVIHQLVFASLMIASIALIGFPAALFSRSSEYLALVWALLLAVPLVLIKEFFRRLCFANLRPAAALSLDSGILILQTSSLFVLAHLHKLGPLSAFMVIALSSACLTLPFLFGHRSHARFRVALLQGDFQLSWEIGRWVFLSGILWAGSLYCCPWLIGFLKGPDQAGVWAASFGITAFINPVLLGMQNYVEPKVAMALARDGVDAMRSTIRRTSVLFGALMFSFSAVIFFLGNRLAILLYGVKYAGNGLTIFVISLASVLGAIGYPYSCGFFARGNAPRDFRVNLAYPVVTLGLGIPLTRALGPLGTAEAMFLAHLCALLLRMRSFQLAEKVQLVEAMVQ